MMTTQEHFRYIHPSYFRRPSIMWMIEKFVGKRVSLGRFIIA
jgi:hypothetical protein